MIQLSGMHPDSDECHYCHRHQEALLPAVADEAAYQLAEGHSPVQRHCCLFQCQQMAHQHRCQWYSGPL